MCDRRRRIRLGLSDAIELHRPPFSLWTGISAAVPANPHVSDGVAKFRSLTERHPHLPAHALNQVTRTEPINGLMTLPKTALGFNHFQLADMTELARVERGNGPTPLQGRRRKDQVVRSDHHA